MQKVCDTMKNAGNISMMLLDLLALKNLIAQTLLIHLALKPWLLSVMQRTMTVASRINLWFKMPPIHLLLIWKMSMEVFVLTCHH